MKFLTAVLAAAVLATSSANWSSIPAECGTDDSECSVCVAASLLELNFASSSVQGPCRDIWDGSWDRNLKECIEGGCSSAEQGCIDELQKWVDSPSVDVDTLVGTTGGNVCMKNGGCKAVTVSSSVLNNIGKRTSGKGGVTETDGDKVLTANCVDKNDASVITAVCVNEDECKYYGAFGFYHQAKPASGLNGDDDALDDDGLDEDGDVDLDHTNSDDSTTVVNHEHGTEDEIVEEDPIVMNGSFGDESSATSKAVGIRGFWGLTVFFALAWNI